MYQLLHYIEIKPRIPINVAVLKNYLTRSIYLKGQLYFSNWYSLMDNSSIQISLISSFSWWEKKLWHTLSLFKVSINKYINKLYSIFNNLFKRLLKSFVYLRSRKCHFQLILPGKRNITAYLTRNKLKKIETVYSSCW